MEVKNALGPTSKSQMEEMMKPGPDGPVFMVNLLKFKDRAEYEDGRETDLTGREAYEIYGESVTKLVKTFGGQMIFAGDVTFLPVGEVEELWDEIAIVLYPERSALLRMSMSEEWQEIEPHRAAGLKGQLNIEAKMPATGSTRDAMAQVLQALKSI